jgi:DNA polymerase I-like protein with 3'-5' exonuclease and polymerase domains
MLKFERVDDIKVATLGYKESGIHVAFVSDVINPKVYEDLEEIYHNILKYLNRSKSLKVCLHIIHSKDAEVSLKTLATNIRSYTQDNEYIKGVVVANEGLSHFLGGDNAYNFLNWLIPAGYEKPVNRFDVPLVHTIPAKEWMQSGKNIKTEGSGVNLLGFVLRAIEMAANEKSEGNISYLNSPKTNVKPTIIKTIEKFDYFMDTVLRKAKVVGIDTETTGLEKLANSLLTIQFCTDYTNKNGQNLWVLPIEHKETPWSSDELKYIMKRIRRWLTDKTYSKNNYHIYHSSKFDMAQFINQVDVQWFDTPIYDVTAGEFSLDENLKFTKKLGIRPYTLEAMENRYGYVRPEELVISKSDRSRMSEFSLKEVAAYGCLDVLTIVHIFREQRRIALRRGYKGFSTVVSQQIGAMLRVMSFMEARGVLVDINHLKQLASPVGPLADRITEVVKNFYAHPAVKKANKVLLRNRKNVTSGGLFANKSDPFIFKMGNDESLQALFFDVLGLQPLRQRANGGGSTDKKWQKANKSNEVVAMFSKHSALLKLKSAFADGILDTMNQSKDALTDGCIRPSYWFTSVLTGRSAATEPNIQQIPSRGEDSKLIKKTFIAHPGRIFIKADFSAHEIRVLGNTSNDNMIIKAFKIANEAILDLRLAGSNFIEEARENALRKGDIHIINVKFFFDKDITKDHPLRTDVKTTVFSVVYGSKAKSLGEMIGKSEEEAQALITRLFEVWSKSKKWMDAVQEDGSVEFVVFSPIMRPRHLYGYLHPDKWVGYAMDRRGPNSIIQGLASDIGYQASDCVQEEIYKTFLKKRLDFTGKLRIMVHDSLTNEVSLAHAPVMTYIIEHGMTTLVQNRLKDIFNFEITVPFGYDMEMGISEGSMKKWDDKRYDSAEEIYRGLAKDNELLKPQLSDCLHNLEWIKKVREKELKDDPYVMTLQGRTDLYLKNMRGLQS